MFIKQYIITILTTLLLLGVLGACNKQLDALHPHNVTEESDLFSTDGGYQRAVEGIYSLSIAAWTDNLVMTGEAAGNNLRSLEISPTNYEDVYTYTHNLMDLWTPNYKLIQHANLVLANVKAGETDSVILEAKAEALFCRAFAYFNLVRCYGRPYYQSPGSNPGAILVTDPDDAGIRARNTVGDTYKQVVTDLLASIPAYTSNRGSSYGNIYASEALLCRVYLYMGGTFASPDQALNDSVVKYASLVIGGPFALAQGSAFTAYFKTQNTSAAAVEDIFATNTSSSSASLLHGVFTPISTTYAGVYTPSPDLMGLYRSEAGDLRLSLFKKGVFNRSPYADDTLSTIKYDVSGTSSTARYSYSPVRHFRLVEMYLNRAEAYVKLGNNTAALADLNVVRSRAGLTPLGAGALTGQALFDAIFTQRRLELAFEGQNAFDYYRNGLTMNRNYTFVSIPGADSVYTMQATDPKVVLRIPKAELLLNGQLQQNAQ